VSAEERKMAAAAIGGKTAQLSVAFGKRAPVYDPAWNVKVSMSSISSCLLDLVTISLHATEADTAQHSTAQHSTAQHGTARHGTAQHSTA